MLTDVYRKSKKDDSTGGKSSLRNALNYANTLDEKVRKLERINLTIHMENNTFGFAEMFHPDGLETAVKRANTVYCLKHNSVAIAVHKSEIITL